MRTQIGIYLCNVLEELGINVEFTRMLQRKALCLQEEIRAGNVLLEKINTKDNLADILIMHLSPSEFAHQEFQLGLEENA